VSQLSAWTTGIINVRALKLPGSATNTLRLHALEPPDSVAGTIKLPALEPLNSAAAGGHHRSRLASSSSLLNRQPLPAHSAPSEPKESV